MSEITNERLAEMEARSNLCPQGPWELIPDCDEGDNEYCCRWHRVGPLQLMGAEPTEISRFLAAARDDVPALVAEVRRLRAEVAAVRDAALAEAQAIAKRCARERKASLSECIAADGATESLVGKASEARRIADEIAKMRRRKA